MAKWIDSSVSIIDDIDAATILKKLEIALRNCYKSENLIAAGSAEKLIKSAIARGHESPLEHCSITYRVICDRGVSHEWVRHRLASYSQESTRYCNYTKDKFNKELTFIYPHWYYDIDFNKEDTTFEERQVIETFEELDAMCDKLDEEYYYLIEILEATPDVARAILPNCLKTEIVCTMNIRELRNFFKLRLSPHAHGDIRKLAKALLEKLKNAGLGILFEDIEGAND